MNIKGCAFATMLASIFMGGSAGAVTMPITYVGGGFITALTSSCTAVGFSANQGFAVVYRPAGNGQSDGLNLQFQVGSALLSAKATSLNGSQQFTSLGITDKAQSYGSSGTSSLKIATSGLNTTIAGKITNLYGDPSCTLTIRAAATQRP